MLVTNTITSNVHSLTIQRSQAQWNSIKARFDVTKFADHKGIIRRRLVTERSMRDHWPVRWTKTADRFHAVFDVFCQRWHLYGMRGDQPLLLKLTANLTPFGTMIFIPAYWSFDPKRDLNWRAITALHKAREVPKQGPKLSANQLAVREQAIRAREFWREAAALKLKRRTSDFLDAGKAELGFADG